MIWTKTYIAGPVAKKSLLIFGGLYTIVFYNTMLFVPPFHHAPDLLNTLTRTYGVTTRTS